MSCTKVKFDRKSKEKPFKNIKESKNEYKKNLFILTVVISITFVSCSVLAKNRSETLQLSGKWLSKGAKYLPINEFVKNKFNFTKSIEPINLQANITQNGRFFVIVLKASATRKVIHEPNMKNHVNKVNDVRYCVFNYSYKRFLCTDTNESITSYGELISKNRFFITNIENGVYHKNAHVWYAEFNRKK